MTYATPEVKLADTVDNVHELIRHRWSPRSFQPVDIPETDLEAILDAARWAASSNNEQPWRFIVARRSEPAFEKIRSVLLSFNQAWTENASVLIFAVAKKNNSRDNSPNRFALHDTGAATALLFLQATALGYQAHGMGGYDVAAAVEALGVPPDFEAAAMIAIGSPGDPDALPEGRYREMELAKRQRKALTEIVCRGNFATPWKANDAE